MRAFWGVGNNVGDTLTPVILEYFTKHKAEWVSSLENDKLLMCGSILEFAKPGDTVLGAGHYKREKIDLTDVNVLALRGKNSGEAPIYGDPAILLPLIYKPTVRRSQGIGYIPHLWDQQNYEYYIDVELPWKRFVRKILSYEKIISTSLHGFIIAKSYGIDTEWEQCDKVPGAKFKYEDYLTSVEGEIEKSQEGLLKELAIL